MTRLSSSSHSENGPPIPGLIGSGPAMEHCYRLARQVARRTPRCCLLGETGTGKELIAKAIHRLSPRGSGPFIRVNCGALAREPAGKRAVRPRPRGLHRGDRQPHRPLRGRPYRHRLPRRNQLHHAQAAGQAAPRVAGARVRARRRHADHPRRHPRDRRQQSRPAGRGRSGPLPRGPLLSAQRGDDLPAAAARAPRGHSRCWSGISCRSTTSRTCVTCRTCSPRRWRCSAATNGPATSASCRTTSSGRWCSRRRRADLRPAARGRFGPEAAADRPRAAGEPR